LSEVTAILYSFARIAPYINDIISMFNVIENSRAGFELIEDLKKKSSIKNTWGTKSFANLNNNISFNNVSFVYPNGNLAIKNVSFKINKGEMVAFVGPSGSGKSTILDLIVGLNFPTNGKFLIDGEQIDNFDKESYLKKIGYVDTNIDLFPYSIKKNVLIFNKEGNQNDLINVYNFVNLKEEINKLNLGQETELQEKGALLSTGQKQRLCIARAIIKDPDLIVLDEATSFLDEKNEILILEKLKNMKNKTIIFATHKKNILKYFDKVFFVENKSVKLINNV
jgi:ABC-type bacteriocin/lantibiotic exporter with double-glycine peptidase domain